MNHGEAIAEGSWGTARILILKIQNQYIHMLYIIYFPVFIDIGIVGR